MTDLWPDGNQVAVGTVRTSLYGARRWAGRGLDGDPDRSFISDLNHDQTYRLRGHLLDYDLFRRLRKRAQARHAAHHPGAIADYQAALRLVRGPVLSGLRPTGYAWLNNHDQRHDLQIPGYLVDTAHELVDIALTNGDIELARWAAETARSLDIDGIFDRPLTDLMRVAHASGAHLADGALRPHPARRPRGRHHRRPPTRDVHRAGPADARRATSRPTPTTTAATIVTAYVTAAAIGAAATLLVLLLAHHARLQPATISYAEAVPVGLLLGLSLAATASPAQRRDRPGGRRARDGRGDRRRPRAAPAQRC